MDAVETAIDAAARFKVAMLDSEDVWNVHPVDLPMYYPESKSFSLKTVSDSYVAMFRHPKKLLRELESAGFEKGRVDPRYWRLFTTFPEFNTFYDLRSDGTYQNYYDLPRGTRQEHKALRVYSDSLGSGA